MKKSLILTIAAIAVVCVTHAQQNIGSKTRLDYLVQVDGQHFPMSLQIDSLSPDHLTISWWSESGRSGKYILSGPSLENAVSGFWDPPIADVDIDIPADQSLLLVSRKVYQQLKRDGKTVFDGYTLQVDQTPDAGPLDKSKLLFAKSEDGVRVWILDNANFPLMVKMENNPYRVDIALTTIN